MMEKISLEGSLRDWARKMFTRESHRGEVINSPLGNVFVEIPIKFDTDSKNPSVRIVIFRRGVDSVKMSQIEYFPKSDEYLMEDIATAERNPSGRNKAFYKSVYDSANKILSERGVNL